MTKKILKRPRDANLLAKQIVSVATGETGERDQTANEHQKDPAAVSLGRRGGLKGGRSRAEKLTAEQRKAIAQKAAQARWRND